MDVEAEEDEEDDEEGAEGAEFEDELGPGEAPDLQLFEEDDEAMLAGPIQAGSFQQADGRKLSLTSTTRDLFASETEGKCFVGGEVVEQGCLDGAAACLPGRFAWSQGRCDRIGSDV